MQPSAEKQTMKFDSKIPLHRSVAVKIGLCLFASIAAVSISLDLLHSRGSDTVMQTVARGNAGVVVDLIGDTLAPPVAFDRLDAAGEMLRDTLMTSNGAIVAATVSNAAGQPVLRVGTASKVSELDSAAGVALEFSGVQDISDRIVGFPLELPDGRRVGALAVEWDPTYLDTVRTAASTRAVLVSAGIGILCLVGALFAFGPLVVNPLKRLRRDVERLSARDYSVPSKDRMRADEFGAVSRAVDAFRTDLAAVASLEEQARYAEAAFQGASGALMLTDTGGEIRAVNPAMRNLLSVGEGMLHGCVDEDESTDLIGQPVQRLIGSAFEDMQQSLEASQETTSTTVIRLGKGRIQLAVTAIEGKDGTVTGYVLEWADVTGEFRRKAAFAAIDATQLNAEFDLRGSILEANALVQRTFGGPDGETRLDLCRDIYPMKDGLTMDAVLRGLSQGDGFDGLWRIGDQGPNAIYIEASFSPIRDADGTVERVLLLGRDVSEAQRELQIARDRQDAAERERIVVVDELRRGMSRLADGDLDASIETEFAAKYEELRQDFNDTVKMLGEAMSEIADRANNIGSESKDISATAEILSQRSESTAATLEQTAAALDDLTGGVKSAAEGADKASAMVSEARQNAESSGEIVVRTVQAMDEIAASSERVASIIRVIDDIAFQTNLLALNAGVEAARAGDAGRGFAVVASEVRALAQRSSDAANEINSLIEQSRTQVKDGVSLVGETGNALRHIVSSVTDISTRVTEIAKSARSQSETLEEINSAVTQLDQSTQNNAARLEETTAASEALRNDAETLVATIGRFRFGSVSKTSAAVQPPTRQLHAPKLAFVSGNAASSNAVEMWTDF
ncbi:Methyl-accepting chemotaxis protein I [Palleronia abyssalis]|uniref:Methyl-accepting chemotaxis protein I n=2 Tax=Palleronia abyssalis TaxID=1501240 RepID=A0A2R8BUN7_9RHOB|nr:Methyl-accepting chemotaxis protein I [Palleronia abyssalis]